MRKRIYQIIELSSGEDMASRVYDTIMFISILACLIPMMFRRSHAIFTYLDWVVTVVFLIDYILRIWTADLKLPKMKKWAFLVYPFTPLALIDLISIIPTLLLLHPSLHRFVILRLIRALKVVRIFKLMRYSKGMRMFLNILRAEREALAAVSTLAVSVIFMSAIIMYNVEPALFPDFFSALYWATVTMTSVGYGDIAPVTPIGQLVSMASSVIGIAIIALPTGIITAGFMKEVLDPADKTTVREAVREAVEEAVEESTVKEAVREAVDSSLVKEALRGALEESNDTFEDAIEAALEHLEQSRKQNIL